MLPMATRNLRRLDEAIRQAEFSRNLTLPLYPKQGQTIKHQHALYEHLEWRSTDANFLVLCEQA